MATINPYDDDPVKGEIWEEGFLAGHADPDNDQLRPYNPDLLDVYEEGVSAGRDERRLLPPDGGGDDTSDSQLPEVALETGLHALGHYFLEKSFHAAGGLIALVLTVISIPGDVQLQPLDPDWEGPADQPYEQYVATCPRPDHQQGQAGVTSDGYWIGTGHSTYAEALGDSQAHGHPEGMVCRVSDTDATCGAVWPGK
jgi:hypothetical protein